MGKYKINGIQTKKKNNLKFMVLVIFLISLIMCISSFGIATWARYRSVVGNNVEAQIAKWSFKVNGEEEKFATIDLADTIDFTHVTTDKIAPGTYGSFDLDIDATGSEVSLDYYININVTDKPTNLKFYTDNTYATILPISADNKIYLDGEFLISDPTMREIRTIYWKWDYRTESLPSTSVLQGYYSDIEGLETLVNEYDSATTQQKQELGLKINDKIDTYEQGGNVLLEVSVKGVQINPSFSLKRVQITSGKDQTYDVGDSVNLSLEFTENVYADNNNTAINGTTAPEVTLGFGGASANNPVAKVASLINTNLKLSEGENIATFVSASGNKINYTYIIKSTDIGALRIANITGSVFNSNGKEINFGTVQAPATPEVTGGTVSAQIELVPTPTATPTATITEVIPTPEPTEEQNSSILMLYDNGNECDSITGGWVGEYTGGSNSSVGSATKGANYLETSTWGTWCAYGFRNVNTIDFTGYSYIVYEIEESINAGGYAKINYGLATGCLDYYESFSEKRLLRYNISNISNGRIEIGSANGCTMRCSRIYLEK